jgi:hypothetical protein
MKITLNAVTEEIVTIRIVPQPNDFKRTPFYFTFDGGNFKLKLSTFEYMPEFSQISPQDHREIQ